MTLQEWKREVFKYWLMFICGAVVVYLIGSTMAEAPGFNQPAQPFTWWHPRLAVGVTALTVLAGNLFSFVDGVLPKRPKPPTVDEEVMEEVRKALRK